MALPKPGKSSSFVQPRAHTVNYVYCAPKDNGGSVVPSCFHHPDLLQKRLYLRCANSLCAKLVPCHRNRLVLLRSLRHLRAGVWRFPVEDGDDSNIGIRGELHNSCLVDEVNKQTGIVSTFRRYFQTIFFLQNLLIILEFFTLLTLSTEVSARSLAMELQLACK